LDGLSVKLALTESRYGYNFVSSDSDKQLRNNRIQKD